MWGRRHLAYRSTQRGRLVAPKSITLKDGQVWAQETREEQLRRKRAKRAAEAGQNLANSLADLDVVCPFEAELRAFSPIVEKVSHLRAYWYRAGLRWVLYECIPLALMPNDERKVRPDLTGAELHWFLNGLPPRMRTDSDPSPISDVQHEMARRWKVWAGPLWVMQGSQGGHLWKLDPWAQNIAIAKGHSGEMPAIGSLPACPWDGRTTTALNRRNRLAQLGGSLLKLQQSGSVEARTIEMDAIQREIRIAEMELVEKMMEPIVDMAHSLVAGSNTRSEYDSQIIRVSPGMAGKAADAYDRYRETGDFSGLKF